MASVTKETRNGKASYRIQYVDGDKRRKRIRLGGLSKKDAEHIASKVQALVWCQISGRPLDSDTARWVANLGDDLANKLADQGLIERRASATLEEFLDQYIEGRKADAADFTLANFRHLRRSLLGFLDGGRDMRSVSEGDADDWRQHIAETYAEATQAKLVKRARQIWKAAVRKRVCENNPFQGLRTGSEANDSRKQFVPREPIAKALEAAPDAEWRLIIALARYGGLRCPSEILKLRWSDVDWAGERFTVTSPKTKRHNKPWRVVPLFPELKPFLEEAYAVAADKSEFCIQRYRDSNSNLRTQFLRILRRAGVEAWPRVFQNLRASRETELTNSFPLHVVTAWLGNTPRVASQHYLSVTEEHFAMASEPKPLPAKAEGAEKGGPTGGANGGQVGRQVGLQATEGNRNQSQETQEASGLTATGPVFPEAFDYAQCPPKDANTHRKPRENGTFSQSVGRQVGHADTLWLRLAEAWPNLAIAERQEVVALAEVKAGACR